MFNHDETSNSAIISFVGHSYVINKDSFLLENYCLDEYTTSHCLYMQAIGETITVGSGIGNRLVNLPKSFEDYEQNKDLFNERLRDNNLFHHTKYAIVAEIPRGTVIKITRVISIAEGEDGKKWAVFGLIGNQGDDISIQIGAGHILQSGPGWFAARDSKHYDPPPIPLPEFLSPSDGNH
jgi:hypothetical protein